ncbi:uncharacterized protein LOC119085682 [Bradysia coprophila]|uniref:uncharacterized protein LOC119085682 n=1 Tax=Bradysia coprophila TaxID=38358 RepID=UPI00187D8E03|nr:uncharacterized protein LOC119085682 [Bradysia coprophila]
MYHCKQSKDVLNLDTVVELQLRSKHKIFFCSVQSQFRRITPPPSLSNTPSRIPIRTTGVEKKIREQENNAGETTTKDERELSPLELRALKAQERSAWRQARMKSLEQDALQAQKMIQSMNELADDILDSKNEVETCQEKIISLELQDPNEMQITPSDEDSSSIITVRSNAENVTFTVDDEALNTPSKLNTFMLQHHHYHHHPNTVGTVGSSTMQTIVEVVNPVISGDGSANKIAIGRSSDCQYSSLDDGDDNDADDADGRPELSLNDKMKNVLQELLEDDRVKMNLSRSLTGKAVDIDDDEDLEEFIDQENRTTNGNFRESFSTHLITSDELDANKNVCTDDNTDGGPDNDDGKNSNLDDCHVYINPSAEVYFNETFAPSNEKLSEEDEKLKEKLLSELHVDEMRTANNDANNQDDESLQEVLETVLTETGKSTNNSGKKKKKKGKNKKK